VIGGAAAISILAWIYILTGAETGMSVRSMTIVSLFPHRTVGIPISQQWTLSYWIIMLFMWWVMMIAMMTPSATPVILLYARAMRQAETNGQLSRGAASAAAFALGYLITWFGFSWAATAAQWWLERSGLLSGMWMASASRGLSVAILMVAGVYQLSPWKHRCLEHCRTPAEFLSRRRRSGKLGALCMGVEHGTFCVGCCWVLMAMLFVGGIMNVLWIAVLAMFVLLEKLAPHGHWVARITGVMLLVWGISTLAT